MFLHFWSDNSIFNGCCQVRIRDRNCTFYALFWLTALSLGVTVRPGMVIRSRDQMGGGQHQEERFHAASGLRILARMIARSLMGEQRDSWARSPEEVDPHKLNARGTGNGKNLEGEVRDARGDLQGYERR